MQIIRVRRGHHPEVCLKSYMRIAVVKSALAILLSELKEFKPHVNVTPLKGSAFLQEFFLWVPRCFGVTLS